MEILGDAPVWTKNGGDKEPFAQVLVHSVNQYLRKRFLITMNDLLLPFDPLALQYRFHKRIDIEYLCSSAKREYSIS